MTQSLRAICFVAIVSLLGSASAAQSQHALPTSAPAPMLFAPGVISTCDYDSHPAFTPDGRTVYFLKITPDFNFWTIVVSHLAGGRWSEPEVAPFSGQYADGDPFITADGKRFFFVSRRPRPNEIPDDKPHDLDVWVMDKLADGSWGAPVNPGPPVNSEASEYYPMAAADGSLYFGSRRKGGKGGADIYRSRLALGKYQEPENLGDAINTEFDEFEPYIAPDESFLIFMAGGGGAGALGGEGFYFSDTTEGKGGRGANSGRAINSSADEFSPKFSPDGKYFFWSSARSVIDKPSAKKLTYAEILKRFHSPQNGLGDIYSIEASALKLER